MVMDFSERTPLPEDKLWGAIFFGTILGAVAILLSFLISRYYTPYNPSHAYAHRQYGLTLLLYLPFIQGCFCGYKTQPYGKPKAFTATSAIVLMDFFLAFAFFSEGYICLLMTFPFYYIIALIGFGVGRFLGLHKLPRSLNSMIIPAIMLAVVADTNAPPPVFANAISDSVTINASPEQVWRYIVEYPVNNSPADYWLWKIGLPAPTQSVAAAKEVGAVRLCKFSGGLQFDEEIVELVPNKVLTFKITKQPDDPEILGHMSVDKGQMYLVANADGTTTVVATSWYRLFVKPAAYFDWWAADITRNVHYRVLNHIKQLAENDAHPDKVAALTPVKVFQERIIQPK